MMEEEQLNNTLTLTLINQEEPSIQTKPDSLIPHHHEEFIFFDDDDIDSSSCSTPFVSAPSSPAHGQPLTSGAAGFFYSAPASPMHFILPSSSTSMPPPPPKFSEASISSTSYDIEFSARFGTAGSVYGGGSMSSADELFLNGQIRPMKLSSHLQRPQALEPLMLDLDESEEGGDGVNTNDELVIGRGRDIVKWRDRSLRRRARSMSPLRTQAFDQWDDDDADGNNNEKWTEEISEAVERCKDYDDEGVLLGETTTTTSRRTSPSSSMSANRNSKRWIFLKDLLLYRSKSEGGRNNNGHKFWSSISFSPVKDRKAEEKKKKTTTTMGGLSKKNASSPPAGGTNGVGGKRTRVPTPHEVHYKASRAQAEEMRKKTYLPYRHAGLFGCLGFSSKSYGTAINGFAKALNPVSSR